MLCDDVSMLRRDLGLLVKDLVTPSDYFTGIGMPEGDRPGNVICFYRGSPEMLRDPRARHLHHRSVLVMNLHGPGTIGIEDQLYPFESGSALLIPPHHVHYFPDTGAEISWLFITFEGASEKILKSLSRAPILIRPRNLLFATLLVENYLHVKSRKISDKGELSALLFLLLNGLARGRSRARGNLAPRDALIERVASYVHRSLERLDGIKEIAAAVGMSESNLRRSFRERCGESLGHFIKRMRMTRATAQLAQSSAPIGEIADKCGYPSVYSFSRAFSVAMGVSPRAYRNMRR